MNTELNDLVAQAHTVMERDGFPEDPFLEQATMALYTALTEYEQAVRMGPSRAFFTNAPAVYDLGWTRELAVMPFTYKGAPVRRVAVVTAGSDLEYQVEQQRLRNLSGLYFTWSKAEFVAALERKELVPAGGAS